MQSPEVNILLVDDHPENLLALEAILHPLGNLIKANSGEEALRCLLNQDFALILLDVQMPGLNGFETAALIRNRERSRQIPIIFLTAYSTNEEFVFKGYSLGAVDYLNKPIDPVILTSKVAVFVELFKKNIEIEKQSEAVKRQAAQLAAMNAQLKQSEERFRRLSACSPVGIFLLDIEGQCIYTNPRCQKICGFTLEESLGEGWIQFIHAKDRKRIVRNWANYKQKQQEFSCECRFQPDSDTICWTHISSSPMFSDEGTPIGHVGTVEDITQRKQAEVAREQFIREQAARQEAEAANRMKDEFLAVLSHELRTPLNAILGWARLLRTRKLDQTAMMRATETIERNAAAQAQLIEDILDVSKIIRGKLHLNYASVNLISVIETVIDSVRPQAEAKAIQVESSLDQSIEPIWGDTVRLQQIVWNLLNNAIKFTPSNGKVEIALSVEKTHDQNKQKQGSKNQTGKTQNGRNSDYAVIQVTDTGIGISADFLPNVFDRFRQADSTTTRSHNGLGLGLSIVRCLVELHNGTVQAASPGEGQGATFTIRLPLQSINQKTASKTKEQDAASHGSTLKGMKILVVDDERDTLEFMTFVLQQYGAIVVAVASVEQALAALEQMEPDVLLSDIGMPEQDGYDLIRQMRASEVNHRKLLPAIALTAYSRAEDSEAALSAGFQAYLTKPVEIDELVKTITKLV